MFLAVLFKVQAAQKMSFFSQHLFQIIQVDAAEASPTLIGLADSIM